MLGLTVLIGGVTFVVLVASSRVTFLVPPGKHGMPHWMAGPLDGALSAFRPTRAQLKLEFSLAMGGLYVAYLLVLANASAVRARWIAGAIVLLHVVLVLSPPLSLTDVFNYIGYGRMGVLHHLNPYVHAPVDSPHTDPSYAISNWHHLRSPYGPLFTLITYALAPLGVPAAFWVWKVVLAASSLGLLAVVWRCARVLGRDPRLPLAVVGLNPLVLVWGLGGDHSDALLVLALTASMLAMLVRREGLGGVALVAAVGIKASALVAVPVLLAGARRKWRALAGFAAAGVALVAVTYAVFGAHLPNIAQQSKFVAAVSIPNLIGLALGQGGETDTLRSVLGVVLAVVIIGASLQAWRGRDLSMATGVAMFASLLVLSWVVPWYVLLVLPFAALARSKLLLGAALVFGVWLILSWMPLMPDFVHSFGFYPTRTPLGHAHSKVIHQLLK